MSAAAKGYSIRAFRGDVELTIPKPTRYAYTLENAEHQASCVLWPEASRHAQRSQYFGGTLTEMRPVVCPSDAATAADRVEVSYNGHSLGVYTISDLPNVVRPDPSTMLIEKLKKEVERVKALPAKPRGAKKQEVYDILADAAYHMNAEDPDAEAAALLDKLRPYLK